MRNIKDDEFIKLISKNTSSLLLTGLCYQFFFDNESQSIIPQDNMCYLLNKSDILTIIKGLENYLDTFTDEFINNWNDKVDKKYSKTEEDSIIEPNNKSSKYYPGYIYFIKDSTGLIKIGLTKDIGTRMKSMNTSNPNIELIHYLESENINKLEKLLHKFYEDKRVGGEWFKLEDKDIKNIKSNKFTKDINALIKKKRSSKATNQD